MNLGALNVAMGAGGKIAPRMILILGILNNSCRGSFKRAVPGALKSDLGQCGTVFLVWLHGS